MLHRSVLLLAGRATARLNKKIGFIGAGAMGSAMVKGLLAKQVVPPENIVVAEVLRGAREKLEKEIDVSISGRAAEAVEGHDVTVLCVKPHTISKVMKEVRPYLTPGHLLISIAAGVTMETLQKMTLGLSARWIRVMPNLACTVGHSATTYFMQEGCSAEDVQVTLGVLSACGLAVRMPDEHFMDAATGVAGSGIAYVFLFIEALADGGVRAGLPRHDAQALAIQTVLGAARLAQQTGKHPGQLKDLVCSPGGTTIEAVSTLERLGLRTAVIEAVHAASQKATLLGLGKDGAKATVLKEKKLQSA